MKRILLFSTPFFILVVGALFLNRNIILPVSTTSTTDRMDKTPYDSPDLSWMYRQRAYPTGKTPIGARSKALKYVQNHFITQRSSVSVTPVGPFNIGGRVSDVEIANDIYRTIYVGSASGGIFRSKNEGKDWTPIFDQTFALSIGDIAISKSNPKLLYVGTGEANGGISSSEGYGIFKSVDGGDTWQSLGLRNSGSVAQVAIDPRNNNRVFVAAMGEQYRKGGQRGIYKTEDGGNSWERVLFINDSTGFVQVQFDPANPEVVFAVAWERFRSFTHTSHGGPGSGIYKSIDGGIHWKKLTNGLPQEPKGFSRISIALSPRTPNMIYALLLYASGSEYGKFKSIDNGESWVEKDHLDETPGFSDYWYGGLRISPYLPGRLFHLGLQFVYTDDDCKSWERPALIHADQQCMAFYPNQPDKFLLGNDAGLYITEDGGKSFRHYNNLPITQCYKIHIDPSNPKKIYCGSQDTRTTRTIDGQPNHFEELIGGDGFTIATHPKYPDRIYTESQYGNINRSDNDGSSFRTIFVGYFSGDPTNWSMPYVLSPKNPEIMYCGTNRIYRSTKGGDNFIPVSPRLSRKIYDSKTGTFIRVGTITTIELSTFDDQVIYAGTDDGKVWVSKDYAHTWEDITQGLPNRWVTRILTSKSNPNHVWVSFSGYAYGSYDGSIYFSEDMGKHWVNYTGNLPKIPVNDLEIDPETNYLFAATDLGLYKRHPSTDWEVFGEALLPMIVTDLEYHPPFFLYAGTFGRSAYMLKISETLSTRKKSIQHEDWSFNILYPHPKGELHFTLKGKDFPQFLSAEIYDLGGRRRIHSEYRISMKKELKGAISINQLSAGLYVIQLHTKDKSISRMFFKQ